MKFLKSRSCYVCLVNLFWSKYTINFNMPRKSKKAKFKPHKVQVNSYGEIFSNSGAVNGTSPIATLNYFFEMFSDRIDRDVIKLVLDECDFNVDQASETLMSLCNDDTREQPGYARKSTDLNLSHYGLPYHNNVVYSDMNAFETGAFGNVPFQPQSFTDISSVNPNDRATTSAQSQVFQEYNDQNFINHPWNDYASPKNALIEKTNSTADCPISEAWPPINDAKERETIASTSNLNPNAPSFIVPMLPMHGLPSPHKSPTAETNRGFWNVPDSRHFSSSASNKVTSNKKTNSSVKDAMEKIKCGHRVLIILRGLPGSGKSTLALKLKFSGVIFSTDDFFVKKGKYIFDPNRLSEAHAWNKLRTKLALYKGITPVIIDNTNTEAWEMKPYVLMGKQYNYEIVILEPDTPWKFNVNSLALRNKHGVRKSKIALMKERYEHDITVDKILATRGLFSSDIEGAKNEDVMTEITNDDNYVVDGNHISLKAVVHTEDNSAKEKSQILIGSNLQSANDKEKDINSCSKLGDEDIQPGALNWENSISDLDELRALTKNDSEDSQSCCSSTNSSSQEVSGWEAITEPDNDFQWSASSNDLNLNSKSSWKSRSADNLYAKESTESSSTEDVISFSQSSNENIFNGIESKPVAVKFESHSEPLLTSSLHKKEKYVKHPPNDELKVSMHNSSSEYLDQHGESSVPNLHVNENIDKPIFSDNYSQSQKLWGSCEESVAELTNQLNIANFNNNDNDSYNSSTESLIIHEETMLNADNDNASFKSSTESLIIHEEAILDADNDNASFKSSTESLIIHEEAILDADIDEASFKSSTESLIIHEEAAPNADPTLSFLPKPKRNNFADFLTISKDHFSNQLISDVTGATEDVYDSDAVDSDWSSADSKKDELNSEVHSTVIQIVSTPKPQRQLFRNSLSIDEDKNTDKVSYSNKKASLLNISTDSIGQVWTFPELTINSPPQQINSEKKTLSFKMSSSCQTEPRDFDYLYKISSWNANINLIGYHVITAKQCNEVPENYDDSKLINTDTYSFTEVVTFDKSTSTDDMVDDIEISQKLAHLQSCFPDISQEDLLHLLEICYNDERWISNLLLDWGYKYNVPIENSDEKNGEEVTNCRKKYNVNSDIYEDAAGFSLWKINSLSKSSTGSSLDTDTSSKNSSEESKEAQSPEEAEEKNVKFQLVLDPTFANQLEQLFGPLPNSGSRKVDVDYEFAELIYEKWKNTVPSEENSMKDEKLELNSSKPKNKKVKQRTPKSIKVPITNLLSRNNADSSFSEIMDMELARQLHIERLKKDDDFRTKMMRSELYNMFPGADTIVLDEIFESNNYSLENSLRVLGTDITQQETIEKKRNVEKFDARIKEWEKTNIFREFENGDWSDWVYQDDNACFVPEVAAPVLSNTISNEAEALREEAAEHYRLRQEYIQKAQAAYCRGMRDVASFYAQQGTEEGRIAKATNKLAAAFIAQERKRFQTIMNKPEISIVMGTLPLKAGSRPMAKFPRNFSSPVCKIDLHGLHIQEAISLLEKFLYDKKLEIKRKFHPTPIVVTVITGQGHHSAQGAKLRPAVLNYLKSSKYSFSEVKTGQLEVTVMSV